MRQPTPAFPLVPLILGHRGAPAELPENTLAGFRRATEQGADGVELDVHASADGVPVVIHDPTLERTTPGRGRVLELSREALRPFVPGLDEVARWAWATRAWLNVELKAGGAEAATLAVLGHFRVLPTTVVSSFLPEVVREVRTLEPRVPCHLLTERWDAAAREMVRETGASGVCLGVEAATDAALAELQAAALPVIVWTVDSPPRIRALLRAGVAGIITNLPAVGAAERRRLAG